MCSLLSKNRHLTHPLARVFLNVVILSPTKHLLKVFMYYVQSVQGKEWWFSSFQRALLCFFKHLSCSFQLLAVLDSPVDYFSTICQKNDNLYSAIRCSYDNELTVCYSSPGHLNLSQINTMYTRLSQHPVIWDSREDF